jgi:hypothetical protein
MMNGKNSVKKRLKRTKENLAVERRKAPDTPETRMRLEADHKQTMQTIRNLASEQYKLELDRNQR